MNACINKCNCDNILNFYILRIVHVCMRVLQYTYLKYSLYFEFLALPRWPIQHTTVYISSIHYANVKLFEG